MSDCITATVTVFDANPRRYNRHIPRNCFVCRVGEGKFVAIHERVLRHRRDGAPAMVMAHRDSLFCCGPCGLALVLACEAVGLEVFGSPKFGQAVGVPLRTMRDRLVT